MNVSFPVSEIKLSGEFKTAYTLYVHYTFPYKKNNNHAFFSVALQPGNITETAQYDEIYEFILPVPRWLAVEWDSSKGIKTKGTMHTYQRSSRVRSKQYDLITFTNASAFTRQPFSNQLYTRNIQFYTFKSYHWRPT